MLPEKPKPDFYRTVVHMIAKFNNKLDQTVTKLCLTANHHFYRVYVITFIFRF